MDFREEGNWGKIKGLVFSDQAGTRTQGPYIKSVLLYQLSYQINIFKFWSAKIRNQF